MKKLNYTTLLSAIVVVMLMVTGLVSGAGAAPLANNMVTLSVKMAKNLSAEEQSVVITRNGGIEKYDLKTSRELEAIKSQIEKLEAEEAGAGGLLDNARDAYGLLTIASTKARLAVLKKHKHADAENNLLQVYLRLLELRAAAINKASGSDTVFTEPYVKLADTLRIHIVTVPSANLPLILHDYKSDPQVESVEVVKTRRTDGLPSDSDYGVQWALKRIGWESVFGAVTPAGTVRVALLDTGVEARHSDLGDNVIAGTSILYGSSGLTDPSGHGTRLAGIIAAVTDNNRGVAAVGYSGVKIMPVTVLNGAGEGQDHDIIAGIVWAADNGADVILMAFSSSDYSQHLQDAIDYAWSKGAVLVASSGNGSLTTPTFPSGDRGVIGVSATDQNDVLASFSNTGPNVFLAAPGTDIYTTNLGNSYNYVSGTSASAAVVAGVAAFMKAVDPTLTNGVIVDRLGDTAEKVGDLADPAYLNKYGHGRVNMANALKDSSTDVTEPRGVGKTGGVSGGTYMTAAAYTQSAVGTYSWTAPANVTQIDVRLWGGGGGGGGSKQNTASKGGGGAGGQFAHKVVTVTPLNSYTIVVGAGGLGTTGNGFPGDNSTFATSTVVAMGGAFGTGLLNNGSGGAGGAGSTVGGIGDLVYRGGNGSNGGTIATGGAGGGGAGSSGTGGDASGDSAGSGAVSGGGNGGAGLTLEANGNPGNVAGGGGGGAYATSRPNFTGGNGAAGRVEISYYQTITFGALPTQTYGNADFSPGATASSGLTVTYSSSNTSVATIVSGNIHITGAGTAVIYANQAGDTSYNPAPQVSQTLTVDKATPTLTVTNSPVTYDGTAKAATVSSSVAGTISNIQTGGAANQTAAGTYAVTAHFVPSDTSNYNSLTGASAGNFIIDKATPTASVTNSPVTYDATAKSAAVSCQGGGTASNILTGGAANQTTAGTYAVTVDCAASTNYNAATGLTAGNFVISAKALTVSGIIASSKIYDADATAIVNVTGAVLVGNLDGGNVVLDTGSASGAFTPDSNVGVGKTVQIVGLSISGSASGSYALIQPTATANIIARPITVRADSKTKLEGAGDPALTYSITSGSLAGADAISGTLDRTAGGTVGIYTINQNTLTAGSNYSLTCLGANFYIDAVMTKTPGSNGTITGPDSARNNTTPEYIITSASGYRLSALTIDGVPVTPVARYTFAPITASHSISATFLQNTTAITSSVVSGSGAITPLGSVNVVKGGAQGFYMKANSGSKIIAVEIDSGNFVVNNPATPLYTYSYTFRNVTVPHAIKVTFGLI